MTENNGLILSCRAQLTRSSSDLKQWHLLSKWRRPHFDLVTKIQFKKDKCYLPVLQEFRDALIQNFFHCCDRVLRFQSYLGNVKSHLT